jgi:hypothetical protein
LALKTFFRSGFGKVIDSKNPKESYNEITKKLNGIFIDIFYQALSLLNPPNSTGADLANSLFAGSCLGVTSRILPSVLAQPIVKLNLSEKILIDASEFMNAVYEDVSQINDILTIKTPTLFLEGAVLFYRGFPLMNTLQSTHYL